MTRLSRHITLARVMTSTGDIVDLGDVSADLNLDESRSPYGEATVTAKIPADLVDPRDGVRLLLEFRESVGDPVVVSDVTSDHTGDVAALTAAYGPDITPSMLTADYFTGWNAGGRAGATIRANLHVVSRYTDNAAGEITVEALTDEALLHGYGLVSSVAETSGSLSVRDTVNFALGKIGAALQPGADDATVVEADAIVWEPGTSGWDYVRNVAEPAGLVVRCDHRRRWTLTLRDATEGSFSPSPLTEATDVTDVQGDLWADGVVVKYSWMDPVTEVQKVRYDTATLTGTPLRVVLIERDTPYPGPGAAQYWLARYANRGRVVEFEQVSDYTARPGQGVAVVLPYGAAAVGFVESVTWTLPDARLQVTTRGTAFAVEDAIDLFPDGLFIDDLTGFIDDLTMEVM